ncbi:UPF0061-domain-containing protein [Nadsonia fulvescens var. elongata DSM 6958]|uniref:Selenoprotein O n=1 Tax=Nadsonia fulvescens var. elongata DSM 6958 TaxID=857566 RepID=A0A1E3PLJ3_9ASCO|nr:UPF0061-domain-containing protein [Nadsonia fulvescens var. elongata DSM 6958]
MTTLAKLPKSSLITSCLTPNPRVPNITAAKKLGDNVLRDGRILKTGCFTWLQPESRDNFKLLAVSPRLMNSMGLDLAESQSKQFQATVAGQYVFEDEDRGIYPYALCYAGFQFGNWAGQLGDGRVINLFTTTNPTTGEAFDVQLKGAGRTPYSRFGDGKAVLRSSIREFLASEYLHALGIPTTRALALSFFPGLLARRERMEPCAIVARAAASWIRVGMFDLHRWRRDRKGMLELADYTIDGVFSGEANLDPSTESKYIRLYRTIVRLNAESVAYWQAYGFMNGVLNTDNTSVLGLAIDFGPFAFMDRFDPMFSPNHDDDLLRYSYKNQPSVIWWNMVRLGEALGELLAIETNEGYVDRYLNEPTDDISIKRAEEIIEGCSNNFQSQFLAKYTELMSQRLGLKTRQESDFKKLLNPLLDCLKEAELDYNIVFRRLGNIAFFPNSGVVDFDIIARSFFNDDRSNCLTTVNDGTTRLAKVLQLYQARLQSEGSIDDSARQAEMNVVNPHFVLRTWILDSLITAIKPVENPDTKQMEIATSGQELLSRVLNMTLDPFKEAWDPNFAEEEARFTGNVEEKYWGMQCSCSS